MKKTTLAAVCLVIVCITTSAVIAQENHDPRLNQKITYEGGYKRLHQVAEDLTKQTGVTIYSGRNDSDWHVRDIPLVVRVKDLSLGKVLRAVADAAHVQFVAHRVEERGNVTWTYRLSRDARQETELNAFATKEHDSLFEKCKWNWDAMKQYAAQPEADGVDNRIHLMAQLIASLSPDINDQMAAGNVLRFKGSDQGVGRMIRQLYPLCQKHHEGDPPPTAEEMDDCELKMKLRDSTMGDESDIYFDLSPITARPSDGLAGITVTRSATSLTPPISPNSFFEPLDENAEIISCTTRWDVRLSGLVGELRKSKQVKLPPEPDDESESQSQMTDTAMTALPDDKDWNRPVLDQKLDLRKPADKSPVFADLLLEASRQAGINIVCEDFTSHKTNDGQYDVASKFIGDTTLLRALRIYDYEWFFNDDTRLLVGWKGSDWRVCHSDLVAEAMLDSLSKKLDREGVGLDDIAALTNLTNGQWLEWFVPNRSLQAIRDARLHPDPMWRLYASLKPKEKALAQSCDGFPLSNVDQRWLADALVERRKDAIIPGSWTFVSSVPGFDFGQITDEFVDQNVAPEVVMRIVSSWRQGDTETITVGGISRTGKVDSPECLGLHHYAMELIYPHEGRARKVQIDGPSPELPIYSPERKAQLLKENEAKESKGVE